MTLSNNAIMVLGCILGFKSGYRKGEAARFGVDWDAGTEELTTAGVMRNGRVSRKAGYEVFHDRLPGQLASQLHQYAHKMGFDYV